MTIQAKKSLGQNFLHSRHVIDTMIDAAAVDSRDIVLEAGPGKGVLTEALLSCSRQVIAIEKDSRLIFYLTLKFKKEIAEGKLKLLEGDILTFDPESENLKPGGYKIVSNIPYYLTGAFLRYFLSHTTAPSNLTLLLQKEVVKRIVARDGKESILSIAVKAYGNPKYIEKVPAKLFNPKPRVDSAIISISGISKKFFAGADEQKFFRVLKLGFSQKRKMLLGNLSAMETREKLSEIFKRLEIPENARAENLPLSKWKALVRVLEK